MVDLENWTVKGDDDPELEQINPMQGAFINGKWISNGDLNRECKFPPAQTHFRKDKINVKVTGRQRRDSQGRSYASTFKNEIR